MPPLLSHRREFLAAVGGLLLSAGSSRSAFALSEPLCVIVAGNSKQASLALPVLRRIFLGEATNDAGGARFIPLNAVPHSQQRVLFDNRVLGMDPDEAARHWIDQRIRGGRAPRTSDSIDTIIRVVARLPGAISYVPKSMLRPEVKALRIDGKLPGDAGYVLHG